MDKLKIEDNMQYYIMAYLTYHTGFVSIHNLFLNFRYVGFPCLLNISHS